MPKKTAKPDLQLMPIEMIERRIFLIRGEKVMLDADLAELYGVETFNLNKTVKRNIDRFPEDFMFQLTQEEADAFEIPNWNVKAVWSRWPALSALCLH